MLLVEAPRPEQPRVVQLPVQAVQAVQLPVQLPVQQLRMRTPKLEPPDNRPRRSRVRIRCGPRNSMSESPTP